MTLRHMRIFVEVCRTMNITRAAENLYLSQPAVSLAISELEDYYGIALFDRIGRRIYITEAGKNFLSYAQHITSTFDEMETGIKNWDYFGTLRVGASISLGIRLLPQIVKAFSQSFPGIKIPVIVNSSETIEAKILNNEIDIALCEGLIHSPDIITEPFYEDRLVVLCSAHHPLAKKDRLTLEDIVREPLLMRELGSGTREIFENFMTAHQIQVEPLWQSSSTRAIVSAVEANIGISVLPYELVKDDILQGEVQLLQIPDMAFRRTCHLVYHRSKYLTRSAQTFLKQCHLSAGLLSQQRQQELQAAEQERRRRAAGQ